MPICRVCGSEFEQTKRKHNLCLFCKREYDFQWRKSRRESGNPITVVERTREQFNAYFNRPYNKAKNKIRNLTRAAVKRGDLIKLPCEVCGNIKSEAHHLDYSNHLDIKWLCRFHHMEAHRKNTILGIKADSAGGGE